MPDDSMRIVDQKYAPENAVTSFSDAYPFLMVGQASLDDLNSKLAEPLPIDRFRPNIVFTGGTPFEEDTMGQIAVDDVDFFGVKLCARCSITTINQQDGRQGKEPLKTLAGYRARDKKIYFGQNLIHQGSGVLRVGSEIIIKSKNNDPRFII